MKESVRKLGLIGAGLWAMTEERVNELVKDLVDKGDISKEEGKKVVQDVLEESKKQRVVITSYSIHYTKLYESDLLPVKKWIFSCQKGEVSLSPRRKNGSYSLLYSYRLLTCPSKNAPNFSMQFNKFNPAFV